MTKNRDHLIGKNGKRISIMEKNGSVHIGFEHVHDSDVYSIESAKKMVEILTEIIANYNKVTMV